MMTPLQVIKNFVEGSSEPSEFYQFLRENDISDLLSENFDCPTYITEGNIYLYMLALDFGDIGNIFSIQDLLSSFLSKNNIVHKLDKKNKEIFKILLESTPKWLPTLYHHYADLVAEFNKNGKIGVKNFIKSNIIKKYKFINKPPKWIQEPFWPINDKMPLLFIGQLDISKISHDDSQLYIFFDNQKNLFETFTQSA